MTTIAVTPAAPARIAITGSSGLYGRSLIREIRRSLPDARILGIDCRTATEHESDEFWQGDICDPRMAAVLGDFDPDTVIHLAYAVQPGRDIRAMRAVNVDGTRRLLDAAAVCTARRVLVASSATVYGAWPDNPPVCDESTPVRPRPDYYYSEHKGHVERLLQDFAAAHSGIAVSWTRPAIVCGPGVSNFLSDIFLSLPLVFLPDGNDTQLQFVHQDDLARATLAILMASARGAFNVAPADAVTHRQIARLLGVAAVPMPFFLMAGMSRLWWTLRLPWFTTPPGLVSYSRHPWVMSSERLRRELGFEFEYSCEQAFQALLVREDVFPRSRTV
ncbi:MAG: NAD-dependent epimerase/dehydratase family protein [Pirellulales bacterium]